MNSLKIPLTLAPEQVELQKKENFYKVLAAVVFILGLLILLIRVTVFSSLVFLLFTFVSYRLIRAAGGVDFLRVMDNSYLYLDEERMTLHRSRYAFQKGELTLENTIFWSRVQELHIGEGAIDIVQTDGERRHIALDMLPSARLREVLDSLYEIKTRRGL